MAEPQGVRAGAVYYDVAFSRETLKAVRAEAQKLGKELDDAINTPAKPAGGAGGALPKLKNDAKEAAAELRRLQDEEKAGTISREQYRQSVDKLRGEMRGMVDEVDRGSREYDTLTKAVGRSTQVLDRLEKQDVDQAIAGINNEVFALRNQLESGAVTEDAFRVRMQELVRESHRLTQAMVDQDGAMARGSAEYRKASNAAGGAERALAALDGRVTKLGMSKQILIGGTELLDSRLRSLGPAGDLAAGALRLMDVHGDQLAQTFGVRVPGALQNTMKVISTLQIVAPIALGAAVYGLARLANQAAETALEIDRGAQQTGLTTDAYQELAFAFRQAGIEQEDFLDITAELNQVMGEAARGEERFITQFARLGIQIRTATGEMRGTEDVLMDTVRALEAIPEPSRRAGEAVEIFGDDVGRKLLTLVNLGADSIVNLREEARELGLVISGDAILSLVDYRNEMSALGQQFDTVRIESIAAFLPVLTTVMNLLQDSVVPIVQDWAEGLDEAGEKLVSSSVAGVAFRASISDSITPLVQFYNLLRAVGAGLSSIDTRMQLLGTRLGNVLGTGDIAWQRGLEQWMGTHPLFQDIDVPDLGGLAEALGGQTADQAQLERQLQEQDAYFTSYVMNIVNAGGNVDDAIASLVTSIVNGNEEVSRALAGLGGPDGPDDGKDPIVEEATAIREGVGVLQQEYDQELTTRDAYIEAVEGYWNQIEALLARASSIEQRAAVLGVRGTVAGLLPGVDENPRLLARRPANEGGMQTDWAARRAAEQADLTRALERGREEDARNAAYWEAETIRRRKDTAATIRNIEDGRQRDLTASLEREETRRAEIEANAAAQRAEVGADLAADREEGQRELTRAIEREANRRAEIEANAEAQHTELAARLAADREEDQRELTRAIEREANRQAEAEADAAAQRAEVSSKLAADREEDQRELTRAIAREANRQAEAERAAAARIARDNAARAGIAESLAPGREAAQQATTILEEYGASLEATGIQAAVFGETHELAARQAELTRQAIEVLIPILGDEHETVQDLIDAWAGYVAAAEEAEKETTTLADHFGNAETVLARLGGAAGGTLGDVIGGFGEVAGVARDIASGNYLAAATSVVTEIVSAIRAVGDAGRAAREELDALQEDLSLIDLDDLTITSRQKVGQFLFIPIYADLEVLPEEVQALAQTIQSSLASGFTKARDIILAGGSMRDVREAIRQGLREAVLDGILQGFLQSQAMQILFADEMARIIELTLEGSTEAARKAVAELEDEIEIAADILADTLSPWIEKPIEMPEFAMPDTILTRRAIDGLAASVANSLASGIESGLSSGVRAYLESGNLGDLQSGLEEGIYASVTDSLVKALVEEGILKTALGRYLPLIGQAFAAGDTDRAIAISQQMMDLIPGLAQQLGTILEPLRDLQPDEGDIDTPDAPVSPRNGGIQVQEITGPTRDLFLDLFRPLAALDSVPGILSRTYDLLAARLPGPAGSFGTLAPQPSVVFESGAIQVTTTSSVATSSTLGDDLGDAFARALRSRGL